MRIPTLAAALALSACVSRAQWRPVTANTKAKAPALYKAAVRTLAERGEAAETADQAAGVVIGSYQESEQLGTAYRLRWRVAVDDGLVKVDSDCQWLNKEPITGDTSWKPCDNQPDGREREAQMIALDIQQAAERMPTDAPAAAQPAAAPAPQAAAPDPMRQTEAAPPVSTEQPH